MAIIQISKIQQRSGDLVDLPQLDEAEFGFASDEKKLFIGKESPNENIEVLTSYSEIAFSQIEGSNSNVFITDATLANGQILAYDGSDWVNKGGNAGGLITLGDVDNVKMDGGAISYVLTTDGVGNLSWTPKGVISLDILTVSNTNPAVVTLTSDFALTNNTEVTINGITGNTGFTALNAGTFFLQTVANSFDEYELYTSPGTGSPYDATAITPASYPFTGATATNSSTDVITVANGLPFANTNPVIFYGDLANSGIEANTIYYVYGSPGATSLQIATSADGNASNVLSLTTATIAANVHVVGGKVTSIISGGGGSGGAAGGVTSSIQYNFAGVIVGDSDFTWANSSQLLTVNGNANIGNVSITSAAGVGTVTANILVSNIATGTAPLTVTSSTRVANLNVSYSNVSDFEVVSTATTGTFYPTLVNALTGNLALNANANLIFNAATGNLSATLLTGTLTTAAQPNITSVGTLTSLTVTGNITAGNVYANSGTLGANTITAAGNVTGANISATSGIITGNGSGISSINASNITTGTLAQARLANSSITINGVTIALGGSGTVGASTTGTLTLGAYLTGGSFNGSTAVTATVDAAVAATANKVVARDTNGSFSANIITATLSGAATTAGTVTTAAQPNITSVGTLTSLTVSGNISAGNANLGNLALANFFQGDGGLLTNVAASGTLANGTSNVTIPVASGNVNISANGAANGGVFYNDGSGTKLLVGRTVAANVNLNYTRTGQDIELITSNTATFQVVAAPGATPTSSVYVRGAQYVNPVSGVTAFEANGNVITRGLTARRVYSGPANGTTSGTAVSISSDIVNVTSVTATNRGVVLPDPVQGNSSQNFFGFTITIRNSDSANNLFVYPNGNGSATINGSSSAYQQAPGTVLTYICFSIANAASGVWYTNGATYM